MIDRWFKMMLTTEFGKPLKQLDISKEEEEKILKLIDMVKGKIEKAQMALDEHKKLLKLRARSERYQDGTDLSAALNFCNIIS